HDVVACADCGHLAADFLVTADRCDFDFHVYHSEEGTPGGRDELTATGKQVGPLARLGRIPCRAACDGGGRADADGARRRPPVAPAVATRRGTQSASRSNGEPAAVVATEAAVCSVTRVYAAGF
ncbi:MAG: hypothetical protein ABEJ85_04110, partial [Haloarculaceae archaeon]